MLRRTFLALCAAAVAPVKWLVGKPQGTAITIVNVDPRNTLTLVNETPLDRFRYGASGHPTGFCGRPGGGTYRLDVDGKITDEIPYDDPAAYRAACLKTFGTETPFV